MGVLIWGNWDGELQWEYRDDWILGCVGMRILGWGYWDGGISMR